VCWRGKLRHFMKRLSPSSAIEDVALTSLKRQRAQMAAVLVVFARWRRLLSSVRSAACLVPAARAAVAMNRDCICHRATAK
jgi:hypothetical protein